MISFSSPALCRSSREALTQEDEPRSRQPLLHSAVVTQWLTRHAVSSHRNSPRVAIGIGRCTNKLKLDIHNFDIHELHKADLYQTAGAGSVRIGRCIPLMMRKW